MSKMYNKLPSEVMHIKDEYVAFCFDEACFYIRVQLEKDETPQFESEQPEKSHYTSFSSMYDSILES